jgi:hypothetical protein
MDRILKVFAPTGHLFALFVFNYDRPNSATGKYTTYRRIYNDDEEDEHKAVYPMMEMDFYPGFKQFSSINEIQANDRRLVLKEVGRDMDKPDLYKYVYGEEPILYRYVTDSEHYNIGMINIYSSFINNTKELRYYSAKESRFDFEISSNSLETNIDCILRIPFFAHDGEVVSLNYHDLRRVPTGYEEHRG